MPTESQLGETQLRAQIRQQIEDGLLPVFIPETVVAGYGTGAQCYACHQPITPEQIEYDVEVWRRGKPLGFHLACYVLWQFECGEHA